MCRVCLLCAERLKRAQADVLRARAHHDDLVVVTLHIVVNDAFVGQRRLVCMSFTTGYDIPLAGKPPALVHC